MARRGIFAALFAVAASLAGAESAVAQTADADGLRFFEQKIRPVLVERCYSCHSAAAREAKKLQARLYLDSAAGLLAGGDSGPAIVKGKSAESLLLKALRYDELEMPPSGRLPAEVVADFAKWIDLGAPDPRQGAVPLPAKREIDVAEGRTWWAFQPLRTVEPPPATSPSATPIDRFLEAARRQRGVTANGPATKEKLLRRVHFDLIGLPPTPERIEAFLRDDSPDAFEKVVDELLDRPQYGEKWARHWLDVARFAESGGYEFDGFRPGAFHYRDWVIRALNDDLPYDEFIRLQLAGDKLRPDDYVGAAASGFLVAGPFPGQITAKTVERIRYDQLDDMLMTVGGSMLGLTLGCVRCHDHKYDPLPQPDYYALASSLAKTVQGTRKLDADPEATQRAIDEHRRQLEPLQAALRTFAQNELPKRFEAWRTAELPKQPESPRWQTLEPTSVEAERSFLKWLPGGLVAHDGLVTPSASAPRRGQRLTAGQNEQYRIALRTHQKNVAAIRIDALTDKSLPQRGPGVNADGSFQLGELRVVARPLDPAAKDAPQTLKLKPVFAAFKDKDQPLANAVDGKPETAWVVKTVAKKDNAAIFEFDPPLVGFAGGTELSCEFDFKDLGLGRFRVALSVEANPATWAGDSAPQHLGEIRAILAANANKLPDSLRETMVRWFAPFDAETAKVHATVRDHLAAEPRPKLVEVYTTVAGGQDVYLLKRGEVDEKLGKAEPGFLQVLSRGEPLPTSPGSPAPDPRIALANWITDVERGAGPLLARVLVNRLWQHHFGEGLVGTPNDFGAQGERPSHPELLEWLATELVREGWKLKPLHRRIVLSAAYRQSHEVSAANLKLDPENRLLWHHRPRRLDAEIIRDALLAVGGNLDPTMYGPSLLADVPRRSVYLRVKRSELIPMMTMFDAPEPTQSVGERVSTTVPTQSLAMMNSPFVRQQAEKLARRVRPTPNEPLGDVVDRACRIAFARVPTDAERARLLAFVEEQRSLLAGDAAAATDKALVEVCHALLCLNEFVYVD